MTISPWLEKHFNAKAKQNRELIEEKLNAISWFIDDGFRESFIRFKLQLLSVVNSDSEDLVLDELDKVEAELMDSDSRYNLKLWASIVDAVE